jgi:hypothetical protein
MAGPGLMFLVEDIERPPRTDKSGTAECVQFKILKGLKLRPEKFVVVAHDLLQAAACIDRRIERCVGLLQLDTKGFISKAPSPLPSPSREEGCNISPPLRGGDEGEGDVCGYTNDRISNADEAVYPLFVATFSLGTGKGHIGG